MKKFLLILTVLAMSFSLGNAFTQENRLSQKVSELTDKLAFAVGGKEKRPDERGKSPRSTIYKGKIHRQRPKVGGLFSRIGSPT